MKYTKLDLWNKVSKTDPNITKRVNYGKFSYTTIPAQNQILAATNEFGPYGATWGVKDCKYEYLRNAAGDIIELVLDAVFWYPGGEFEISTDIKYSPGQDCRKKILTDLTTKALSKLGFNADVFLGKFDDNKYVQQVTREFLNVRMVTDKQLQLIEDLLRTATISPERYEEIERVMTGFNFDRASECIKYLQDNQPQNPYDKGGRSLIQDLEAKDLKTFREKKRK